MNDDGIIVLSSSSGDDEKFGLLDIIEYEGEDFIVLYPLEGEDKRLVILKVEEDATSEEYDSYVGIDDDELVQKVYAEYLKRLEQEEE